MKLIKSSYTILISFSLILISCNGDDDNLDNLSFDIFTVENNGLIAIIDGEIKTRSLQDFNDMLEEYPDINLINMEDVPGSNDDEINFQIGIKLQQKGIATHILDDAEIASGGVDFFLAGTTRSKGSNTKIGVHSWSDGDGNEATDFPVDSEEHKANIEYYENLGFTAQWASDFYFFTINAAPAAGIHWMTEEEISQFEIIN